MNCWAGLSRSTTGGAATRVSGARIAIQMLETSAHTQSRSNPEWGDDLRFLIVDEFIGDFFDARALKTAFEFGVIDRLIEHRRGSAEALGRALDIDPAGL